MKLYITKDKNNNLTVVDQNGSELDAPIESIVVRTSPHWNGLNQVIITILDRRGENNDGILKYLDDETVQKL